MSTNTEQLKANEYLGQGNNNQHQGNMAKSVESYQKALELNPNSVAALSELAQIYKERKEYEPAFTYYLKLVSLRPKKPSFFQSLARVSKNYAKVLLKKNDLNRAIAAYGEFLNQKLPKNHNLDKIDRICQTLGESIHKLTVRQGEFSSAITFFQKAIEKSPYKVWSYYHLGNLLAKQDKLDEAIACYEKAVAIRPKFSLALLSLGRLLLKKERPNEAFQCGIKILHNRGNFKNTRLNHIFIELLSIKSNSTKWKEALQKAIEQIETSSSNQGLKLKAATYRNIGKILRNQGQYSESIEFYQKSLYHSLQQSRPEFVNLYWEQGKLQAPDFSVIGFGKCGTTAFYDYLGQHPHVLPAVGKEPMYLYHGLVKSKDVETKDWSLPSPEKDLYLAHFAPRPEGSHFITGEASTTNVFPGCDTIMSSWFPNIKLIAIVREPVRRTISHYEQLLKVGSQKGTLEEVINSELDELEASTDIAQTVIRKFRRGWKEHIAMSLYVYPLERWMNLFPREQFLILTNEQLAQYPEDTMKRAFEFLGLPECNSIEYHRRNVGSYPQVDAKLLSRLSNFFRPHNQRLEELLGRKFNWDDN